MITGQEALIGSVWTETSTTRCRSLEQLAAIPFSLTALGVSRFNFVPTLQPRWCRQLSADAVALEPGEVESATARRLRNKGVWERDLRVVVLS